MSVVYVKACARNLHRFLARVRLNTNIVQCVGVCVCGNIYVYLDKQACNMNGAEKLSETLCKCWTL
jgi:hypothetical protein